MENSLSTNSLIPLISAWTPFKSAVNEVSTQEIPFERSVKGLNGSLPSFFVAETVRQKAFKKLHNEQYYGKKSSPSDYVIIAQSQKDADEYETDLETILADRVEIHKLPWWGMIPYRPAGKGSSVFGSRAGVLAKLSMPGLKKDRIFIIPQRALLTPVPPPSYMRELSFTLRKGQAVDPNEIAEKLQSLGYLRVPKVGMRGEFAVRGEVIDVFMPGEEKPVRIVFDFEEIEQIKSFEVETQTSSGNHEQVLIYPMKEVVWTDELVIALEKRFSEMEKGAIVNDFASYDKERRRAGYQMESKDVRTEAFSSAVEKSSSDSVNLSFTDKALEEKERLIEELAVQHESEGEELFYGILWDKLYSIVDYFRKNTIVFCYDSERLSNSQKAFESEFAASYRTARQNLPVFPPKYMLLDYASVINSCSARILFKTLGDAEEDGDKGGNFVLKTDLSQSFFGNINYLKEQLQSRQNEGWHIFIFADNPNQSVRIREVVKEFIQTDEKSLYPLEIYPQPLAEGFSISEEKILVIQENEIFGRKKAAPKSIRKVSSKPIDSFVDLTPGDYVVHVNYGIGLFKGIERIKAMGTERDYIKLEYADKEFLSVPIEQVNMVQRYIGSEGQTPRLDLIGSKSWNNRKSKVQQKVEEIAEKLIDLYSKRQASRGFAFPKDGEWQSAFEAAFPYEDTPDQFNASQDIKEDMEKPVPMDRLVCGDVGYGKTEIAMRAAFKAVMGGKQVVLLAPTTILAEQHYENCLERFKNFPVSIGQLSRFVPPARQKEILAQTREGKIDILIGTHRILQKDVQFKDLGLMIIDEEQRFGVKDKEKLKVMKTNIDCLAMSATPIPRTLHMSLLKIRDMSLLTTPPQNRQPIETSIEPESDERIKAAVRREVSRGGQVFFLHNRVETLDDVRYRLEKLLPEMMIEVAHGKMTSEELDDIFRRFKLGGFHILVATTIIENGIDIPNVNTIIIDRADMYGVSQLYQLRGRVGRSDRKAYAYLFYPENKVLSEIAMKRLQVINDFTELGSGFKIAMKDMEIRGAGNLLGKDQSGEVYAVGFEMYLSLLNSAIERLSNSDWKSPDEVLLELEYTGFIPDTYISDASTKMEMYKKIAAVKKQEELESVYEEMLDRFGDMPDEVTSLLSLAKIRILCTKLSITSLIERQHVVTVEFGALAKVNVDKLLHMISLYPRSIKLNPQSPNKLMLKTESIDLTTKCDFIKEKLEHLL
ncbi:MAG: transcription-repair coupling factor [Treponema sp.]|nr:transcription-repair coupling factor [Treponema sp.]